MMHRRALGRTLTVIMAGALTAPLPATVGAQAPAYPEPAAVRQALARQLERPKVALDPKFATVPAAALVVEQGTFVSEPGKRVPSLIVRPATAAGARPAVVMLHGTGGTKEQMRDWLDGFAARGYIAMAIDARYHGAWVEGGAQGSRQYNDAAIAAWRSQPGASREYPFWYDSAWDVVRAVDYLTARPDVDASRIGVVGISMGGIQAYLAAAIDSRIAAVVPLIATQSLR